jgi:poly-beta-1,6-N-acetyl-D-glucosamine synthase
MDMILRQLSDQIIFWMAWIIIPILMEIIPAFLSFVILLKKKFEHVLKADPERFPEVTIIMPVFNSEESLYGCIESVWLSNYPKECISIILVNNKTMDFSFDVFKKCQDSFRELSMEWLNSEQGKSKALNLALFNSSGKYIIQIDSDGKLHPNAIRNIVKKFENDSDISSLTGAVLTDPELIVRTEGLLLRLTRKIEFFEYAQSFLAGRNYESETNNLFTLSGACSAFRRSAILKTQLYHTETVSEDTQLTFQIKKSKQNKVQLCENAFFLVDPIESFQKLYTQRQRWQQGELEVSHIFIKNQLNTPFSFFTNSVVRLLMFDHTFAFPRMIWYFALICLTFLNYPMKLVAGSIVFIYFLYVFSAFLYYLNVCSYLSGFDDLIKYYRNKWYLIFLFPIYNFVVFWIRFAGIINSIKRESRWKTFTLKEEKEIFSGIVEKDFRFFSDFIHKVKRWVENEE